MSATAISIIEAFQYVFLFYFLALYIAYFTLHVIALCLLPRYMNLHVISELPQSCSGFDLPITIVVPAYNEEAIIVSSIRSLLQLSYSEFEIVVANDGSKDGTLEVLQHEFNLEPFPEAYRVRLKTAPIRAIYASRTYPNLRVIDKENGGRADSLNAAINSARYPLFCAIDADSVLQRNSLQMAVQPFLEDPRTIACGGTIRVANGCQVRGGFVERAGLPTNLLALFQVMEYLRSFLFGRLGWLPMNSLPIISGAFGIFDKEIVVAAGGYNTVTLGEDMELVMRLHRIMIEQRRPYRITFVADPCCWTEAPEDLKTMHSQRVRWQHGMGDSLMPNCGLIFKRGSGFLGWVTLPFYLIIEWIGPLIELVGLAFFIITWLTGMLSFSSFALSMLVVVGLGMLLSVSALLLEEVSFHTYPRVRDILLLFLAAVGENVGYRQLNSYWRLEGLFKWMIGKKPGWGEMTRTATWQAGD